MFGGLRASHRGAVLRSPSPRHSALMALLVLGRREPISVGDLIDAVWGGEPPASAGNQLQRLVGQVRRMFEPQLPARADGSVIVRVGDTYRLGESVSSDLFDLDDGLVADPLALVNRRPFAGLESYVVDHPWFVALERRRASVALDALIEARSHESAGENVHLIDMATSIAAQFPFEEKLQALLIDALGRSGRRSEALALHTRVATTLREELGLDPGPELRLAHQALLLSDTEPAAEPDRRPGAGAPAQLPRMVGGLVMRPEAQASLNRVAAARDAGAVLVTAIGGMGGIGKTTIAVAWAHELAPRFPDGQLYINLRGFDADRDVMSPEEALSTLLIALGVARDQGATLQALSASLRSALAGRRYLLVLDNARDANQVRPLLPGDPGCLAIVTSRNRLSSLVLHEGAVPVQLDRMSNEEATELLVRRLGVHAVEADPSATATILRACAGLPLALSVAATRIAMTPALTLTDLAREIEASDLTEWSTTDDADGVPAVFAWSYDTLNPPTARAFSLLGAAHPAPRMSRASARSLLGCDDGTTGRLLRELCDLSLLQQVDRDHYVMHDLLRAYASGLPDLDDAKLAAQARLINHYVHTSRNVMTSFGREHPRRPEEVLEGVLPEAMTDPAQATSWYRGERDAVAAISELCVSQGRIRDVANILMDVRPPVQLTDPMRENVSMTRKVLDIVLDSKNHADLPASLVVDLMRDVGNGYTRSGEYAKAERMLSHAMELTRDSSDLLTRASALRNLGTLQDLQGRPDDALATLRQAFELAEQAGSQQLKAAVQSAVSEVYLRRGDVEAAYDAWSPALSAANEGALTSNDIAQIFVNLASLAVKLGRFHEALQHLIVAQESAEAMGLATAAYLIEVDAAFEVGQHEQAAKAIAKFDATTEPGSAELYRIAAADEVDQRLARLAHIRHALGR